MRDLMVLCFMLLMVPMAASNAFIAYMLWCWFNLISVISYLYGFMAGIPYVQLFAIITLFAILSNRDKPKPIFKMNRTLVLWVIFSLHSIVVASMAFDGIPRNIEILDTILKSVLFCLVMPMIVNSRFRIHVFVIIIVLGLSFHGLIDGLKFLASGGTHLARGLERFGDNNNFAVIMAMVIPMALYLYKYTQMKWMKLGFLAVTLLTIFSVIATRSRGGMLTLIIIGIWMLVRSKRKVVGTASFLGCIVLVVAMAPAEWSARMNTVQNANEDSSFMTRVAVWKKSTAIALDYPFVGGGFYAVQSPPTFAKYRTAQGLMGFIDTPDPYSFAAHSIYFQVIGDMGFLGFFIYILILMNTFVTNAEINRLAKLQDGILMWAIDLANMLAASLVAFMVGGALLSAAYTEVVFMIITLMETIKQVLLSTKNQKNPNCQ